MAERRLITAALPYINNIPHLGNIVGSHLPADIFARFCRAKSYDVLFIGGSDENGTPSEIAAEEAGVPIMKFLNRLYREHVKIYKWFNISYDNFSRTTRKIHHETTKEFFKKIYKNGYIKESYIELFYDTKAERFLPDRYVEGTCGICGYEDARGDQCDKCTSLLDVRTLKNPVSKLTGTKPEVRKTKHLFLKLSSLSPKLEKWIKSNKQWRSQVSNLALGWIKEGLRDRCITRDLKHGVSVPLKGYESKVFYVWFDAPIGYVSSTREKTKLWRKYWQNPKSKIYHFLGKDNIPFHTIFWPGMMLANGTYTLPYSVVGYQYLNYEGGKFSKSKKQGVFCERLKDTGLSSDIFRVYLTFVLPESSDSDFKWKDFQARINNDLIGNLGNFANRTLSFAKRIGGKIEKPKDISVSEEKLTKKVSSASAKIDKLMEDVRLRQAFAELLALSSEGNKYFDASKPWEAVKSDRKDAERTIYFCLEICRSLAVLGAPFVPESSAKLWNMLGLKGKPDSNGCWKEAGRLGAERAYRIGKTELLFKKLENSDIERIKRIAAETTPLKDFF